MTDEYIRRVEAEEATEEYCCRMCKECSEVEGGCVSHAQHCEHLSGEEILKPVKSADVQPVKHGRWKGYITSAFYGCDDEGEPIYRDANFNVCSECGRKTVVKEKFCPNCGARMDGDRDD